MRINKHLHNLVQLDNIIQEPKVHFALAELLNQIENRDMHFTRRQLVQHRNLGLQEIYQRLDGFDDLLYFFEDSPEHLINKFTCIKMQIFKSHVV